MAHENSQTLKGMFQDMDGKRQMRWYNAFGNNANRHLEKLHPFEKDSYLTEQEAVEAAKLRSNIHHLENPLGAPYFNNMYNGEGFLGDKGITIDPEPEPLSWWNSFKKKYNDYQEDYKRRNPNSGRFPADGWY